MGNNLDQQYKKHSNSRLVSLSSHFSCFITFLPYSEISKSQSRNCPGVHLKMEICRMSFLFISDRVPKQNNKEPENLARLLCINSLIQDFDDQAIEIEVQEYLAVLVVASQGPIEQRLACLYQLFNIRETDKATIEDFFDYITRILQAVEVVGEITFPFYDEEILEELKVSDQYLIQQNLNMNQPLNLTQFQNLLSSEGLQVSKILQEASQFLHKLSTQFSDNPFAVIQNLQKGSIFLGKYEIISEPELLEKSDSEYKNKYKRAKINVKQILQPENQEKVISYEIIYIQSFAPDLSFIANFYREVMLKNNLNQNQEIDFGQIPGGVLYKLYQPVKQTYITLEQFFQQHSRNKPENQSRSFQPLLSEEQTIQMALKILNLLDNLHSRNVLHLNFNPQSIHLKNGSFLEPDLLDLEMSVWNPKDLLGYENDFFNQQSQDKLEISYRQVEYMSPEHLQACQNQSNDQVFYQTVNAQSDIYSLGCIIYRCITGEVPQTFSKDTADHISHKVSPLPLEPYEIPSAFEGLVLSNQMSTLLIKVLAEDKKIRHQNAIELKQDLTLLQQSLSETPKLLFQALDFCEKNQENEQINTTVDFREYNLNDFALEYLYKYIYESNIEYVCIYGGALPIAGLKNDTIEELNLENKSLFAEDFIALFHILPYNTSLRTLCFAKHQDLKSAQNLQTVQEYYETSINYFVAALQEHTKLLSFDISGNDIGTESMLKLLRPLSANTQLELLNLSNCKIGIEGCVEICNILLDFQNIKFVYLAGNQMQDEGAIKIAELIKKNHNVLEIGVQSNNIEKIGGKALGQSLTTNFSIQKILFDQNLIPQNECDHIQQSINFNTQYIKMKQNNQKFGEYGHNLMAESLKRWVSSSKFVEEKLKTRLNQCEDAIDRKMAELLLDAKGNLDLKPIPQKYTYTPGEGRIYFEGQK